jgi:hypothetical protein
MTQANKGNTRICFISYKEGLGEEMMKGGVKYQGRFKQDRFDGSGELIWPNGNKLSGVWKDSKLVGVGILTQPSGKTLKVKQTDKGIEPVP